jgi:hypothetical protein
MFLLNLFILLVYIVNFLFFLKYYLIFIKLNLFNIFCFGLNNNMYYFLLQDFHIVNLKENEYHIINFFFNDFFFLLRNNFYISFKSLFIFIILLFCFLKILKFIILHILIKNLKLFYTICLNNLNKYLFFKIGNYNFIYQIWYKFAKNQKNTYLSLRFRLVYLNKKFMEQNFNNNNMFQDQIQEYFILKRKNFFDSYFKPVKIRKFAPLINFKKKFYTKSRKNNFLKGGFYYFLKDYEDRINKKEQQQKTLRVYEGIFGVYIYQELLKKTDQKQAKFVRMKLNRD